MSGFFETIGAAVIVTAILAATGIALAWRFGVAVQGSARICQNEHGWFVLGAANEGTPHLDIELVMWARFGQAIAIHHPTIKGKQELRPYYDAEAVTLAADGARSTMLLVMFPLEGAPLLISTGDRVTVTLPMRIGHRKLALKVEPPRAAA